MAHFNIIFHPLLLIHQNYFNIFHNMFLSTLYFIYALFHVMSTFMLCYYFTTPLINVIFFLSITIICFHLSQTFISFRPTDFVGSSFYLYNFFYKKTQYTSSLFLAYTYISFILIYLISNMALSIMSFIFNIS
jgi:hypothetical protein